MTQRNDVRFRFTRIALMAAIVLSGAMSRSSSAQSGTLLASDSYATGSNPAAGQYTPYVSGGTSGSLFSGQSGALANLGFANGGYVHGAGTNNFIASSTGLINAADGSDSSTGSVFWDGASGATTKSVARNLNAFTEGTNANGGTTGTYWMSMLVSNVGNSTTTSNWVLGGFGGTVAPTYGTTTGNMTGIFFGFSDDSTTVANQEDLVLRYRNSTGATSADQVMVSGANGATIGQTYLVVAEVSVNGGPGNSDPINWWVDPADLNSVADLNNTSLAQGTITNDYSFQGEITSPTVSNDFTRLNYAASNFDGNAIFDQAELGTTLSSIAPAVAVPEPASIVMTALGCGGIAFGWYRQRRRSAN